MKTLPLGLLSVSCLAQTLVPVVPGPVVAGQAALIQLVLTQGTDPIVAVQWATVVPSGGSYQFSATTTEPKTVACGAACVLYGLNQTALVAGIVVQGTFTPSATTRGMQQISLMNLVAADNGGVAVPITSTPVQFMVFSPFDLNQDGMVNAADLTLVVAQADGSVPCTTADFNHDGICNVQDVVLLINDALIANPALAALSYPEDYNAADVPSVEIAWQGYGSVYRSATTGGPYVPVSAGGDCSTFMWVNSTQTGYISCLEDRSVSWGSAYYYVVVASNGNMSSEFGASLPAIPAN